MSVYKMLNDMLVQNIRKYLTYKHPELHNINVDSLFSKIFTGWKCECLTTNHYINISNGRTRVYTLTFINKIDFYSFNLYINKNDWIVYHYMGWNTNISNGTIITIDKILNMCKINLRDSPRERIEKILFEVL